MRTTIDAAGRVVIPRAARIAARLKPGTELEVRVVNGVAHLEPAIQAARIEKRGRLVVATRQDAPAPLPQEEVDATLEEVRDAGSRAKR